MKYFLSYQLLDNTLAALALVREDLQHNFYAENADLGRVTDKPTQFRYSPADDAQAYFYKQRDAEWPWAGGEISLRDFADAIAHFIDTDADRHTFWMLDLPDAETKKLLLRYVGGDKIHSLREMIGTLSIQPKLGLIDQCFAEYQQQVRDGWALRDAAFAANLAQVFDPEKKGNIWETPHTYYKGWQALLAQYK
jgi:hypothetical protein